MLQSLIIRFLLKGILILGAFILLIFFLVNLQADPYIVEKKEELLPAHTAIVLGAAILKNGNISTVFKDRVDVAIELYREGKVKNILVSGDDGTKEYNEVNPAREYLLAKGIPSSDIFLDHAGFDTYSSMYRARDIFQIYSAIVVTQSFHLPRAIFIGRNLEMDVYGLPADKHLYRFRNNVREVFADVKAVFNVIYNRKPKFLGEEIPITGDSSESI